MYGFPRYTDNVDKFLILNFYMVILKVFVSGMSCFGGIFLAFFDGGKLPVVLK